MSRLSKPFQLPPLNPHQRQLNNLQIRQLIQRNAVVRITLNARMLLPGWIPGKSLPQKHFPTLETVVNHVDHICQIAGNVNHSASAAT